MNGIIQRAAIILAALALSSAWAQTGKVSVLSDKVNLRAKPRPEAEVAGQVNANMILEARGTNGEWVAVTPPDSVGLWVFSEFVKDSKVATDKLNIRSGAGINYPVVGAMVKDDPVVVRSVLGEWTEIAPPPSATLWVHKDYVNFVIAAEAPVPAAPVVAEPLSATPGATEAAASNSVDVAFVPAWTPPAEWSRPLTNLPPLEAPVALATSAVSPQAGSPPPDIREQGLVPLAGQGEVMEFEGTLHKTSLLDFGRVSNYCLVDRTRGRPVTVCYVRGNDPQLKEFEGRRLRIKGDGFWVKGGSKAVVVPKQIMPLAD